MSYTAEVTNGIDNIAQYAGLFRGKRLGLVTGPTGVDRRLVSTVNILRERFHLAALFAPEHGIRGDGQAGDAVETTVDARSGLPVHSLYGAHRWLPDAIAGEVDMLVFDMQDAGVRYYTYLYTLADVMIGAARLGLPVAVLDRVNPLGGLEVEGNVLDERFASFVGRYTIPARYGLTIGEFARFINGEKSIGCELSVVPCGGWHRGMYYDDTGLPWVMPSPNLPTVDTSLCYPGMCLIEGTNLSEGRGTTKPFELIGAPWIDPDGFAEEANELVLAGVRFRPASFRPTFSKHAGQLCGGVQLHVTDRQAFRPYRTGLMLLGLARWLYGQFEFVPAEDGGYFIDKLLGSDALRQPGFDADGFLGNGAAAMDRYMAMRRKYLLYE